MCDMERGEEVTEDEREEREFLRLSAAMGAEFLRLVLDAPASAAGAMGPGRGAASPAKSRDGREAQETEEASGEQAEAPHEEGSPFRPVGVILKEAGDEWVDSDSTLNKRVIDELKPVLREVGPLQVTQMLFGTICDRILRKISHRDGLFQTAAVYRVMTELVRGVRNEVPSPESRTQTFLRFTGEYLLSVGLSTSLYGVFQQAEQGIVEDTISFPPVDIPNEQ